jgi:hypothetical protein
MAVIHGIGEVGGLALAVAGFAAPEKTVVRPARAVALRPVLTSKSIGVAGTF